MDVRVGLKESWAPKNWCFWTVVLEKTLESPLDCKEIQPVHPKGDQFWIFIGRSDVEAETPGHGHLMQRTDSFEETLMLRKIEGWGEGEDRGWNGWMVSPTQWTRVWVNSGSWWQTGRPGVLRSMGSQKVGHDWVTEPNWQYTTYAPICLSCKYKVKSEEKSLVVTSMLKWKVMGLERNTQICFTYICNIFFL